MRQEEKVVLDHTEPEGGLLPPMKGPGRLARVLLLGFYTQEYPELDIFPTEITVATEQRMDSRGQD